jgi:regulatory protein
VRTGAETEGPSAFQRALARLARRDHSEAELRRVLERKGHQTDEIDEALARLRERRFVDDASYATRFARTRMSLRGQGRNRIRQALRQRGVDRQVVERGLEDAASDVSEAEVLDDVARRYWRTHQRDEPERRLRRLSDHLYRRGFPGSLIFERLRALWPSWSDALAGDDPVDEADF